MSLETRVCQCGTEFEDSEWSVKRECDTCQQPTRHTARTITNLFQYQQVTNYTWGGYTIVGPTETITNEEPF